MNRSMTVSAEIALSLVVPHHRPVPLAASLCYSADDPYAIRIAFHLGTDEPVEWIFARDLLAIGLEGPAGEGDAHVWPTEDAEGEFLNIALSSPLSDALFETPREPTAAFLTRTYQVIARGRESEYVDIDGELDGLL